MSTSADWGSDPHFFGPRHAFREGILLELLDAALPPGARVLDVGCGAGTLSRALSSRGHAVTGLDASARFVAHAAAAGGEFVEGDATALPFGAERFDAVVAGEVLEHLAEDERAIAELFRVLAPGGVAVASVPVDMARWDASDDWAGHVRRYEAGELEGKFERAGFVVERAFRWGFPLVRWYHERVYLPVLAKKAGPSGPMRGWKRAASAVLAAVFQVDRRFDGHPGGLGLMLVARKP